MRFCFASMFFKMLSRIRTPVVKSCSLVLLRHQQGIHLPLSHANHQYQSQARPAWRKLYCIFAFTCHSIDLIRTGSKFAHGACLHLHCLNGSPKVNKVRVRAADGKQCKLFSSQERIASIPNVYVIEKGGLGML